jgi:hypothetical protein
LESRDLVFYRVSFCRQSEARDIRDIRDVRDVKDVREGRRGLTEGGVGGISANPQWAMIPAVPVQRGAVLTVTLPAQSINR